MTARFTTITLAPALDRTVRLDSPLMTSDVCRVRDESVEAGGKGLNVAKMLARLGCPVAAGGLLGDANCEPFERMLHDYGIENRFVRVHGETRRNLMLLGTDGVERRINFPAFPDLEFDDYLLRQIALLAVKRTDAVVISGSLPQRFPARAVADLMAELHALGKDIVLDTSGEALSLAAEAGPILVKPNRKEAEQLSGIRIDTDRDAAAAAQKLLDTGLQQVYISLSADGVCAAAANGERAKWPCPRVHVVNATGGLRDTVPPYNAETGEGRGYTFQSYNGDDFLGAIDRALGDYYGAPEAWEKLAKADMELDFSWTLPAQKYIALYQSLI